jgi:hypothetical protein
MMKTTFKTKLVLNSQLIRALVDGELTRVAAGADGGGNNDSKGPGTCPVVLARNKP